MPIRKLRNAAHCIALQRIPANDLGHLSEQLYCSILQQICKQRDLKSHQTCLP